MVFQQEILETVYPDRYFVQKRVDIQPVQIDSLVNKVNASLSNDTVTSVKIYSDPTRTVEGTLASGSRSYIYVDPYSCQVTGTNNTREGFFHKVMTLHRWLMFSDRESGRVIVGVSTIFLIIILITGIVRWWKAKSFKIKTSANFARKLFDLHRVLGIYASIILLVCALTGLMWSFGWYRNGVAKIVGVETSQKNNSGRGTKDKHTAKWQNAFDKAIEVNPNYDYVKIDKSGTVTVLDQNANHPRATDTYKYSPKNDSFTNKIKYGTVKNSGYMMGWAYVIHVGSWGGVLTKWLTLIAAIIGASLPITGYVMFFRKLNKKKTK